MNTQQIIEHLIEWAHSRDFSAPYGILDGEHVNSKGRKYSSVTFGRARSLDATVEVYNRNFMILRASNRQPEVFRSLNELQKQLDTL